MEIKVGDTVAIRGDLHRVYVGNGVFKCAYFPDQLVDGKYVMHTGHFGIWTGVVEAVKGDMVKVSGAWRGVEFLEVMKNV